MNRKNNISKKLITAGAVAGLGIGTVLGQNQDTTQIELYDPIPVLKEGESYNFGGKKGSFYTLNTLNKIVEQYDAGLISPDTVVGDIEMDFFRDLNTTGFAEYSTTNKDRRAMATMSQILNNVDNGQEIGEFTENESYLTFKALKNAGYLRNPGDRVKLLFPRTDQSSMAKINGKKAIIPAKNVVRGVIFEYTGDKKGQNNVEGQEGSNPRPYVAREFSYEIEAGLLGSNEMHLMPQIGVVAKYGEFGLGFTGAYMQNNAQDSLIFMNTQGNGGTKDYTNILNKFGSLGAKLSYDITDRFSIALTGQKNYKNKEIGGSIRTIVGDGTTGLDQTVQKNKVQNNSSYNTWGPEARVKFSDSFGMIAGSRFKGKAFEGAYTGFSYKF